MKNMNGIDLSSVNSKITLNTEDTFNKGVISCGYLSYKGESYKITHVGPTGLECDTNKLFGKFGDEFPSELLQ